MAKHKKKKKPGKKDAGADDMFSVAAQSIKRFRKVTNEIGRLSTGQKLVGGLALVAAGLIYLEQRRGPGPGSSPVPTGSGRPRLLEARLTSATEEIRETFPTASGHPAPPDAGRKARKGPKPGKAQATRRRIPGTDETT